MYGTGCHEDFFNTCGYIQSSIIENAKGNKKFRYNDENVIAVSCGGEVTDTSSCGQNEFMKYAKDNSAAFGLKHNKTKDQLKGCDYDNKFIPPFQSQVQCLKGGYCVNGRIEGDPPMEFSDVTCNACASFFCNVNGKFIYGVGCLNDFERICKRLPAAEMQKIKAGKKFYNYIDENNMVSSCSYGDYCSVFLFNNFSATVKDKFDRIRLPILASKGEICPFDPKPPKPSEPSDLKENGSNGYKLSGMCTFGFIIFYLW
uniref:Uncharacterized protein n=1 Tax=Panagrolaimus davidi TaxID=227884 RepID=A0A914Q8B9_9BILA